MDLTVYLLELISANELVCLPGLGGFISKQESAFLDTSTNIFTPPHSKIAFNERLLDDGGRLVDIVAARGGCTNKEASDKVALFVESIKNNIKERGKHVFPGIGILEVESSTLIFKPSADFVVNPADFGLPQLLIKFKALDRPSKDFLQKPKDRKAMSTQDVQSTPEFSQEEESQPMETKSKKPIKKNGSLVWLYIITPLVLLGGMATFLGVTDDGRKMLASMHLVKSEPIESDSTEMLETATEEDLDQATVDETSDESFDNATSAEETIKKTEAETWENTSTETKQEEIAKTEDVELATSNLINGKSGRYFIIMGGFANKRNAIKLREKLIHDGLEAKVISPTDGSSVYRVSLGDYSDKSEAAQKADAFKSDYGNDLWVMKY